jgi:hypothetical protein
MATCISVWALQFFLPAKAIVAVWCFTLTYWALCGKRFMYVLDNVTQNIVSKSFTVQK